MNPTMTAPAKDPMATPAIFPPLHDGCDVLDVFGPDAPDPDVEAEPEVELGVSEEGLVVVTGAVVTVTPNVEPAAI